MDKISSQQLADVMSDAASTLRSQQETIHDLQSKLASRSMRDRVEKLAHSMHEKGIELDSSVEVLADRLEKMAEATPGKLDAIEHGVDMVGPDMGMKVAQLTSDVSEPGAQASDFERFIVGTVG
jgi:uncharacterized protein Yka (UPF0111/DUF47 family)